MINDSFRTRGQRRCLAMALITLLLGLFLYLFPETIATLPAPARNANLWPWPIGPLALRFIASVLLAAALGAYLVARRPDRPTVIAFFTVVAIVSGFLLLHVFLNWRQIDWSKPLGPLWAGAMALACIGSFALVMRLRRQVQLTSPPLPPTPLAAATVALFIFVLTGLVGATMLFMPDVGQQRWPWDLGNHVNVQLFGALFLAVGLSSLWSWRQPSWYGYDVLYPTAGTFAAVALLASFLHWNLFADRPITSWIFVVVYLVGAVLGFYPYLRYSLGTYKQPLAIN